MWHLSVSRPLASVRLDVDEELTNSLGGLFGPSTANSLEFLALGVVLGVVPAERNNLLMLKDVIHVVNSLLDHHTLDGTSNIVSVLVMGAEISDLASSRLGSLSGHGGVLNHCK